MTLADLIDAFRDEAHDHGNPPFWSDARLTALANEAERETCRRGDMLIDSSSSMCSIGVIAGDPDVPINPAILDIRRARMSLDSVPLVPVTAAHMDDYCHSWESDTGTPSAYVTDYQTGFIRLYPAPVVDDALKITVRRLPANDMAEDEDEPEIRREHHQSLVQWMLYRAYSKQDADSFDPAKAARALAEFEREFGKRSSARNEAWQRSRPVVGGDPIA